MQMNVKVNNAVKRVSSFGRMLSGVSNILIKSIMAWSISSISESVMNIYSQENSAANAQCAKPPGLLTLYLSTSLLSGGVELRRDYAEEQSVIWGGGVNKIDHFIRGCTVKFCRSLYHRKDPRKTGKYRVRWIPEFWWLK